MSDSTPTLRRPVLPGDVQRALDDLEKRGLIIREGDRYFTVEAYHRRRRKVAAERPEASKLH